MLHPGVGIITHLVLHLHDKAWQNTIEPIGIMQRHVGMAPIADAVVDQYGRRSLDRGVVWNTIRWEGTQVWRKGFGLFVLF